MASEMFKEFLRGLHPGEKSGGELLATPWMRQSELPWDEYPRPQLRRDSFFCLNGWWHLRCGDRDLGGILVPYPPESQLSGVGKSHEPGELLIYERSFTLPGGFRKDRVLLHFGAVDQLCRVFVNDREIGYHEGGYLPFSFDVTDELREEENTLRVEVRDDLNHDYPWGKQSRTRGGMWYTPVSGIWQTVWMESVPRDYIRGLRITAGLESATVEIVGGAAETAVLCDGRRFLACGGRVTIRPEEPQLWSPESPHLYHFSVESGEDRVESYFALRQVSCRRVGGCCRTFLNGKPFFFHGLLDQGYFSDGIFLPGSPEGYTFDIETAKKLGFNTLRKHIKIEPERFYYDCDRLGMLVFQDMVNSGDYYYLRDTALPTAGYKKGPHHPQPSEKRRKFFAAHVRETADHLHNHPCIVLYTLFNEGWGQHDTAQLWAEMKQREPERLWNAASGWFADGESDIQAEHVYFGSMELHASVRRPLMLTEFGGYSWSVEGHRFNRDREYGYRKYTGRRELEQALQALYRVHILPQIRTGLCGAILTQLSDVEDETNGMVTYDRQVVKPDPAVLQEIAEKLREAVEACAEEA